MELLLEPEAWDMHLTNLKVSLSSTLPVRRGGEGKDADDRCPKCYQ
jgi:hypothetical protein